MRVNLYWTQTLDIIGDAGMTRTCDPQFRKPIPHSQIYSEKLLQVIESPKLISNSIYSFTCLISKHFYLILLSIPGLSGEKLGKNLSIASIKFRGTYRSYFEGSSNSIGRFSRNINQISSNFRHQLWGHCGKDKHRNVSLF